MTTKKSGTADSNDALGAILEKLGAMEAKIGAIEDKVEEKSSSNIYIIIGVIAAVIFVFLFIYLMSGDSSPDPNLMYMGDY